MSDEEKLIARLRKQADNAGAVMDRIADQGSIEDGDTWAVDEHVEAYELAEVATMAITTLDAVTAERDEARAQVTALQAVIERVRGWREENSYISMPGRWEPLVAILEAAPSVSLAEHDAQVLEAAADKIFARLPDGTGNGRAYNSYTVVWMLRAEAARLRVDKGNPDH